MNVVRMERWGSEVDVGMSNPFIVAERLVFTEGSQCSFVQYLALSWYAVFPLLGVRGHMTNELR